MPVGSVVVPQPRGRHASLLSMTDVVSAESIFPLPRSIIPEHCRLQIGESERSLDEKTRAVSGSEFGRRYKTWGSAEIRGMENHCIRNPRAQTLSQYFELSQSYVARMACRPDVHQSGSFFKCQVQCAGLDTPHHNITGPPDLRER